MWHLKIVVLICLALAHSPLEAQTEIRQSVAFVEEVLPESTILYGKFEPTLLLDHPLRNTIQESSVFQVMWDSPQFKELKRGIAFAELAMGAKLERVLRYLSVEGIHVAYDRQTKAAVLLTKAKSDRWLKDYLSRLVSLARSDAQSKKQPDPIREASYRDVDGFEINRVVVAQIQDYLMITNKSDLAKSIIDRSLDPIERSLKDCRFYKESLSSLAAPDAELQNVAFLAVDLQAVRNAGLAKNLFRNTPKDFGTELLLGGVLAVLNKAPFAAGALGLSGDKVQARFSVPNDPEWFRETREFYVGPESSGRAAKLFSMPNPLAQITTYRNLSELWLRAGDLFDQRVNDQLAQADNTLTTLFSGKDFGTDILGALEPQLQLVAAQQSFAHDRAPAIRLPSFGLVGTLKAPTVMQRELKRTFQSFVGFLNVAGAMEGRPQLDLDSETTAVAKIYWAEYVVDVDRKYEDGLPVEFNFSPAIAFRGNRIFLASSVELARKWVNSADDAAIENSTSNTAIEVDMAALQKVLQDNRLQLISQNMLEKGHSTKEAEQEVDTLLRILQLTDRVSATLAFDEQAVLEIELAVKTNP
jgi:hypothetical protein